MGHFKVNKQKDDKAEESRPQTCINGRKERQLLDPGKQLGMHTSRVSGACKVQKSP